MNETLLIEIGTEELPPRALSDLARAFADGIARGLEENGIEAGTAVPLASPRRLAVKVAAVADKAPDREKERLGPSIAAAFDDSGRPTKAALGFARSCGVEVSELSRIETDKGDRLAWQGVEPGKPLAELLPDIATDALRRLPIPKRMRWGDSDHSFVRPVHWLVALHGREILPLTLFGCEAGRYTRGHRFQYPDPIELSHADQYEQRLEDPGRVLVDMTRRRQAIREQVVARARDAGGEALVRDDLLDEVSALVEWPVALSGAFEERYLTLPREVLVSTLESHQRYFPVAGRDGNLMPRFVTVANIDSPEPAAVVAGNERVVRPRLADALFFWQQDLQRGLAAYAEELDRVTFQRDLGSLADKTARIGELAGQLARELDAPAAEVARAGKLAKADLLTEMVGEFPELQGTMGRYYAAAAGEPEAVAMAIEEQYLPRHAGAPIAAGPVGRVLALADRLDTLAGVFALGQRPTGEKDPFALRRAALGVLRTVIEGRLDLDLADALARAVSLQPVAADAEAVTSQLLDFHLDRMRGYYAERGVEPDVFEAVAATGFRRPLDFDRRVDAVREFLALEAAAQLCGAHKRIRNILKGADGVAKLREDLLTEPAEVALGNILQELREQVAQLRANGDYAGALAKLAELQSPVDRFFDEVLVMSEDADLRENRLALLAALDVTCRSVADISRLTPSEVEAA